MWHVRKTECEYYVPNIKITFQGKQATIIKTRCKRETEIDVRAREPKTKVPFCRKPTRLLIPINKRFSTINANPHNALPRRTMTPVVIKPKVLNATEDGINIIEVVHNNDSKTTNDTGLDTIEASEPTQAVNSTTIDNKINNKENENKVVKENNAKENSDLTTIDKEIQNDVDKNNEPKDINQIEMAPEIMAEADVINGNDKYIKNGVVDTEINQVPTKEVTLAASNLVQKVPPSNVLTKFKVVPGIPIKRRRTPVIIKNKPQSGETKGPKNSTLPKTDTSTESTNKSTIAKEVDNKVVPVMVPLTILTDKGKIPIKIVPKASVIKAANESADLIPQTNAENQIRITIENPVPDASAQSSKTGAYF